MGEIFMSIKDQKIYKQAIKVVCKKLIIVEFAQLNNTSYRQSQRVIKKVKELGMEAINNK
jgi:hypothetical protein